MPVTDYAVDSIVQVHGGQYHANGIDAEGKAYIFNINAGVSMVGNDSFGNPFKHNRQIKGFYQSNITIRDNDSSIWYWGVDDPMNYKGGSAITAPIKLTPIPGSRKAKKVEGVSNVGVSSLTSILVLCTDGTMWRYSRGNRVPAQITTPEPIRDFTAAAFYATLAESVNGKLYSLADGYDSRYAGTTSHNSSTVEVTSNWTAAGAVLPLKKMEGNNHTIHIIDANNNLFGCGSNTMGNIGNGVEYTPMRNGSGVVRPFEIDIAANSAMLVAPTQIQGKVKDIFTSQTITFYKYAIDMGGNLYSWGRNKSMTLGNNESLCPYVFSGCVGDYAAYPNAIDVPMPKLVTTLTQTIGYPYHNFSENDSLPPVVGAGIYQWIDTKSTTLYGLAFQQEHEIASVSWSYISGGGATITSPTSSTTTVTGLTTGEHTFRFSATNTYGQTKTDDIKIYVTITPTSGCSNCIITNIKFSN